VEGIRTDVRVVNLSLIAVDWYIELLRRQVNDSPPVKMSIPQTQLRGKLRNQVFYYNPSKQDRPMSLENFVKFIGEDHPLQGGSGRMIETHYPTRQVVIPVDKEEVLRYGVVPLADSAKIVDAIPVRVSDRQLLKDEVAILDIISSNIWERPIYWAVTTRMEKLFGMQDYTQLEGLALRLVPIRSQSENQIYGLLGSGRVKTDILFRNVMERWRWGNFDKLDTYVNNSYGPSVQSMQFAIQRGAMALLAEGEEDKAVALTDKYFEAFPDMNFEYGIHAAYMLDIYSRTGHYEKAKPHMKILARNVLDRLNYFASLSDDILRSSYHNDFQAAFASADRLVQYAQRAGDEDYLKELQVAFGPFLGPESFSPEFPLPPTDTLLDELPPVGEE